MAVMKRKCCATCGLSKPMIDFHRDASQVDGHMSRCIPCRKILRRESYLKNRQKRLDYQKEYQQKIYADPIAHREAKWLRNLKRRYKTELRRKAANANLQA